MYGGCFLSAPILTLPNPEAGCLPETGAMVCDACIQQGDLGEHADTDCAPPAEAAAPTALASGSTGPRAVAGKRLCSTCSAEGASKRKKTGACL
jgi:hypothetical protein